MKNCILLLLLILPSHGTKLPQGTIFQREKGTKLLIPEGEGTKFPPEKRIMFPLGANS
jgi:hypothetical protein